MGHLRKLGHLKQLGHLTLLDNLSSSKDNDTIIDESNAMQNVSPSVLSNTFIRLIMHFVMTWKIMHNLSDAAMKVLFYFLKTTGSNG